MHLLLAGDRIRIRRVEVSYATMLAKNQVEIIRQQENSLIRLADTAYEAGFNGNTYEVERIRIIPQSTDTSFHGYGEYQVTIKKQNTETPIISIRLLQGLRGMQTRS